MIYKMGNWDPSKIPVTDLFRATLILLEMGSLEPRTQVLGGVGIFDFEGFSLRNLWYLNPSLAQKIIAIMVVSNNLVLEISHRALFNFFF